MVVALASPTFDTRLATAEGLFIFQMMYWDICKPNYSKRFQTIVTSQTVPSALSLGGTVSRLVQETLPHPLVTCTDPLSVR